MGHESAVDKEVKVRNLVAVELANLTADRFIHDKDIVRLPINLNHFPIPNEGRGGATTGITEQNSHHCSPIQEDRAE